MIISVIREPDDSLALRASIGGGGDIGGYYLVFRGDPEQVLEMLEAVAAQAKKDFATGDYVDRRGRAQG